MQKLLPSQVPAGPVLLRRPNPGCPSSTHLHGPQGLASGVHVRVLLGMAGVSRRQRAWESEGRAVVKWPRHSTLHHEPGAPSGAPSPLGTSSVPTPATSLQTWRRAASSSISTLSAGMSALIPSASTSLCSLQSHPEAHMMSCTCFELSKEFPSITGLSLSPNACVPPPNRTHAATDGDPVLHPCVTIKLSTTADSKASFPLAGVVLWTCQLGAPLAQERE